MRSFRDEPKVAPQDATGRGLAVEGLRAAWHGQKVACTPYNVRMWALAIDCYNKGEYGMAYGWAGMVF